MDRYDCGSIDIVFGDANFAARQALKSALIACGFRNIRDVGETSEIASLIKVGPTPDVIICDADLPPGNLGSIIKDMRANRMGADPFVPVIMMASAPTAERLRRIAMTGVDHVLVKPVSPDAIMKRLVAIIERRKPFIVLGDYVGPDRTPAGKIRHHALPEAFEVPTMMRAKALRDETAKREINAKRTADMKGLKLGMLSSKGRDILRSAKRFVSLRGQGDPALADEASEDVLSLIDDLRRDLMSSDKHHFSALCQSLSSVVVSAQKDGDRSRELSVIPSVAQAIVTSLSTDRDTLMYTFEIIDMVKEKLGKPKPEEDGPMTSA